MPDPVQILIELALQEDIGAGDITSDALFGDELVEKSGILLAKQDLNVAGLEVARRVFDAVDHHLSWKAFYEDGARVPKGTALARVSGRFKSLLRAERTALNFLQHLSGVATLTRQFVDTVQPFGTQILDTRKTVPGFRRLEKYAVKMGGGTNHRAGLYDQYLIKDNHLMGISTGEAVRRAREHGRAPIVEVEIQRADYAAQIEEALRAGADILLLDNFTPEDMEKAVHQIAKRAKTEASGGINLQNVADYAATGVDAISIGALTHSAKAADISLEVE